MMHPCYDTVISSKAYLKAWHMLILIEGWKIVRFIESSILWISIKSVLVLKELSTNFVIKTNRYNTVGIVCAFWLLNAINFVVDLI